MARNENIVGFADQAVPDDLKPDTDIVIEGGIWTTLAASHTESNGNLRGSSARQEPVHGTHGVILLHNVRRVTVRNITVRQSKAFAVHLGNVKDFVVDGLALDGHRRVGVHVSGPAGDGVSSSLSTERDPTQVNAWRREARVCGDTSQRPTLSVSREISGLETSLSEWQTGRFVTSNLRRQATETSMLFSVQNDRFFY